MKHCIKCGKELKENEIICSNCGYNTEEKNIESHSKKHVMGIIILVASLPTISIISYLQPLHSYYLTIVYHVSIYI